MKFLVLVLLFVSSFISAQTPEWILDSKYTVVCQDLDSKLNIPVDVIKDNLIFELSGELSVVKNVMVMGDEKMTGDTLDINVLSVGTGRSQVTMGDIKFYESETLVCVGK